MNDDKFSDVLILFSIVCSSKIISLCHPAYIMYSIWVYAGLHKLLLVTQGSTVVSNVSIVNTDCHFKHRG